MLERIKTYLNELGQPHLALGLASLTSEELSIFFEKLKNHGPALLAKQRHLLAHKPLIDLSCCQPLSPVHSSGSIADHQLGDSLVETGKVGCLILAGGQGTRLGYDGPKGMVPVTPITGKSLFQFLSERALHAGKRAQQLLDVAIMTSAINHATTQAYFEQHSLFGLQRSQLHFFSQQMLPLIDERGNWLLSSPGILAEGPDGNGNALRCFYEQGIWHAWRNKGVEYLNVIFIDNPLADPFDSAFLGFTARCDLDIGMKVIKRRSTQEKMGIAVQKNGKIKVIEYSEFSAKTSARYSLASPGLFCFRMEFIHRMYAESKIELPLHLAYKTASVLSEGSLKPEKKSVFKCETFQFDLLDFTDKTAAILCPRQQTYAPIKNAHGDKSPAATKKALRAFDKQIYRELSGLPAPSFAFELDPAFYYPTDALKRRMKGFRLPQCDYIRAELL